MNSVEGKVLSCPRLFDNFQRLFEPFPFFLFGHAKTLKLIVAVSQPNAEIQPAVADNVQHRRVFRQPDRVHQRDNIYSLSYAYTLGYGGYIRSQGQRRAANSVFAAQLLVVVRREVVFRQPDAVETQLVGEDKLRDGLVIHLFERFAGGALHQGQDAELHIILRIRRAFLARGLHYVDRRSLFYK